jgi:hypothetical protein
MMFSSEKIVNMVASNRSRVSLTFLVIHPCGVTEPQRFVSIAYPSVPSRVRLREALKALVDFTSRDMELCDGWDKERRQEWLSELEARFWDHETAALQVANSKACRIGVDKVSSGPSTVDVDLGVVLAVQEVAVVD